MSPNPVRIGKENADKLQGRSIDIIVGSDEKIYSVHESLIRVSSPFFERALAGEWKESVNRTVQLPNDKPRIFAFYVHWLYYGTLPVFCGEPGLPRNAGYLDLAKAYVLGDKLLDTRLQNTAIDAIIEKTRCRSKGGKHWFPMGEVITYTYQNTTDSAPIRELLVDIYVNSGHSSWLYCWADPATIPRPFLLTLASKFLDQSGGSKPPIEDHKYYIAESFSSTKS